jgi:lactobin A/cerein 7B family class IIb bacteriocin
MFKELNKNEMMDVVGGGYPVGVPVYGTKGQYLGIRMVSSDSGIKFFWILRENWGAIPFDYSYDYPPRTY